MRQLVRQNAYNHLNKPESLKSRSLQMTDLVTTVSDKDFDNEVIESNVPVVVDFWAEWCGPCKSIAPIVQELASDYQGKVKICKLNIDESPDTPTKFSIRGIPTLLLFKNGAVVSQKVGAAAKSQLSAWIDSNI